MLLTLPTQLIAYILWLSMDVLTAKEKCECVCIFSTTCKRLHGICSVVHKHNRSRVHTYKYDFRDVHDQYKCMSISSLNGSIVYNNNMHNACFDHKIYGKQKQCINIDFNSLTNTVKLQIYTYEYHRTSNISNCNHKKHDNGLYFDEFRVYTSSTVSKSCSIVLDECINRRAYGIYNGTINAFKNDPLRDIHTQYRGYVNRCLYLKCINVFTLNNRHDESMLIFSIDIPKSIKDVIYMKELRLKGRSPFTL